MAPQTYEKWLNEGEGVWPRFFFVKGKPLAAVVSGSYNSTIGQSISGHEPNPGSNIQLGIFRFLSVQGQHKSFHWRSLDRHDYFNRTLCRVKFYFFLKES